jgi:hypothetical protein
MTASAAPELQPRAVIVHHIRHARAAARAAAELGVPVVLRSAAGASRYAGAGWFATLIAEVRREVPGAEIVGSLDCADAAGDAMAALHCGIELIRFTGRGRVRAKLAALAASHGAALDTDRRRALDMADGHAAAALRRFLARSGGKRA